MKRRLSEPSRAGMVLLDTARKPIYVNTEALKILAYPQGIRGIGSLDELPAGRALSELFERSSSPRLAEGTEVISGKRHYTCRSFSLRPNSERGSQPITAILIERPPRIFLDTASVAKKFHLTPRECEATELLVQGLTNKAIAEHMKIAPTTVKVFVKMVMVKMGVSTRTAVFTKAFESKV